MAAPSSWAGLGRVLMTSGRRDGEVAAEADLLRRLPAGFRFAGGQGHPQPVGFALEAVFLAVGFGVESGLIESR